MSAVSLGLKLKMEMGMTRANFVSMDGDVFFLVGGKNRRAYSTKPGQEEIFQDERFSLHVTPAVDGWIGCRLYLLEKRRRVFHFSVHAEDRRLGRSGDVYRMDLDFPGISEWALALVLGERRDPPIAERIEQRTLNAEELEKMFRLIDDAFQSGCGWSTAPITRKDGRYVFDNLEKAMPGIPKESLRDAFIRMMSFGAIEKHLVDSRKKKYALRANIENFIAFMRHEGWLNEECFVDQHEVPKIVTAPNGDGASEEW